MTGIIRRWHRVVTYMEDDATTERDREPDCSIQFHPVTLSNMAVQSASLRNGRVRGEGKAKKAKGMGAKYHVSHIPLRATKHGG